MPVMPTDTWERLSPGLRRWLLIGAVLGAVALIAVIALDEPATPGSRAEQARERLTRYLLTDADPRALGIDGLANRLSQLERELAQATTRERQRGPGEAAALNRQVEQLRQSQQTEIQALQQEITGLREALETRPGTLTETPTPPKAPEPVTRVPASPPPAKAPALDDPALFAPKPASPLSALSPQPAAQARPANGELTIRVVEQAPTTPSAAATTKPAGDPADTAIMIPAGSLLRGVLLSGMDAPTGRQARRDPYPALVRLKHTAILPNRFRADVRECFITVAGYGELSSERAFLRTEVITCVRRDGGMIGFPVDGYQEWPSETLVQVILWASPDIEGPLAVMNGLRAELRHPLLRAATAERAAFLRAGVAALLIRQSETREREVQVLVTVKLPLSTPLPSAAAPGTSGGPRPARKHRAGARHRRASAPAVDGRRPGPAHEQPAQLGTGGDLARAGDT
ncbi:TraC family protein [Thiorhodococcus minor]|uniref:TraC family protein n=1 Tax=Thiorhodococcus minor TaxID=57489 RepID=UPI002475BE64|nr:TraC family protein [Thiorhodococcus minor]